MDSISHANHDNNSSSSTSSDTSSCNLTHEDETTLRLLILPDALFIDRILLYLGPRHALTTLGLVSKRFHRLATCKRVWHEFCMWRASSSKLHHLATETKQAARPYQTNGIDVFESRASRFLRASQDMNPLSTYIRVHCSEWLAKKELIPVSQNVLQVATTTASSTNDDEEGALVWQDIRCRVCLRPALAWCNWPTCHNTSCESRCNQVRQAEFYVRPVRFAECNWCKLRLCTMCCSSKMSYCFSCKRANCLDCANIICLGPTRSCSTQKRIQRGNIIRVITCFEQSCWKCAYKDHLSKVESREQFDALDKIFCQKCASASNTSVLKAY